MNEQVFIQRGFFNYLNNRTSSEFVLNKTMETLNLGKGAVYKRLNGSTALTSAEMIKLAKAFRVSLDNIFQPEQYMAFFHPFWKRENKTGVDFMDRFAYYLKPIVEHKYSRITYLANELPVTYYFSHKYIFNFLLSIWNHLHWNDNRLIIDESLHIDSKMEKLRAEIQTYYEKSDVTEIWNSNMLSNLYQQVIFCITIRAFPNATFLKKLMADIERLINTLRNTALSGKRNLNEDDPTSEVKIYLNEFGNYSNILLYESEKIKGGFIGIDIPQFMISYNPHFFDFASNWIDNIKKRSVLISSEGYQYRELFFLKLENDFKAFQQRVEKLVGVYYE